LLWSDLATTIRALGGGDVAIIDMRALSLTQLAPLVLALAACGSARHFDDPTPDASGPVVGDPDAAGATGCTPGLAGSPCVLALYDAAVASCDAAAVAALRVELDARAGLGPLWAGGRALVRTSGPTNVAGGWNDWSATAMPSAPLCGSDLDLAVGNVPTGYWQYKLVSGTTWSLDPTNPAFAYDDFTGNADGRNSVLDTPDSGRGRVITLDRVCSTALGNCRTVTAYLPAGYDAPANAATTYPVLFMHDGQNVWSDHDCCFGHTGWEVDTTLDAEIAGAHVRPIIVIAADNTTARNDEYGLTIATMLAFIEFQVGQLQPAELARVRWDHQKVSIAGSSLGGLVSMELALRHPDAYAGVASLSGAFWPNMDTHQAVRDDVSALGKQALAVYLDSGGDPSDDSDGAADTIEVRDRLVGLGWVASTSPACTPGPSAVCYHLEPGATHDELAWKSRVWRALRFLYPVAP
jgi:predicted alpha/beta superfamily hydrolase